MKTGNFENFLTVVFYRGLTNILNKYIISQS